MSERAEEPVVVSQAATSRGRGRRLQAERVLGNSVRTQLRNTSLAAIAGPSGRQGGSDSGRRGLSASGSQNRSASRRQGGRASGRQGGPAPAGVLFLQPGRLPPAVVREEKPKDDARREEPVAVMLHNDDYTPADYVVRVLHQEFALGWWQASWTMVRAHVSGRALVRRFPRAEAEVRVASATRRARGDGWPLRVTVEESE